MQSLFDFSQIPVIDNHCHLFNLTYQERDLAKILSLSLQDMPQEQLENSLIYRKMIAELKDFLGVSGCQQRVLDKRKEAMLSDYSGYVERLFKDGAINTLLIDLGYKPAHVSLDQFEDLVPGQVKYIYRIESVLDDIWKNKYDFNSGEEKFYQALDEAINGLNIVAMKSIIGYRTGLAIKDRTRLR
ncbi:hypothetical protein N752_03455 [Desulforamulus aquiferis]|nr:hypothetical protein [Desulforamulus aquiferis]RYD06745.1 hypothetical protein N752_03455 [Desulforamulus aquiferis]